MQNQDLKRWVPALGLTVGKHDTPMDPIEEAAGPDHSSGLPCFEYPMHYCIRYGGE